MNEAIELINSKILAYSGIRVSEAQLQDLLSHIEKKAALRNETPVDYCHSLIPHSPEFDEIINLVTVNETYFFREELQFDYLQKEVFPKYRGRNLTIWTCSCATGEEPISLLALALSMNVNLTIYASDIDDTALAVLEKGRYSVFSLRADGQKYHSLLEPYSKQTATEIVFHRDFLRHIHTFKFNLIQDGLDKLPFSENMDLIFMRNVFIYIDKSNRSLVTRKVAERLNTGGLLFFSMNEIASLNGRIIPKELCKINSGMVYFFIKVNPEKNGELSDSETKRRISERDNTRKTEKLRREVKRVKLQKFSAQNEKLREAKAAIEEISNQNGFDAKKVYEEICLKIHNGDFENARMLARNISGTDTKKYSYFMQGYIEYQSDNRADAESLFASAEAVAPDFWPAFFYHGMVLRDLGQYQPAQSSFTKCRELLARFGAEVPYDFTLDSFSPSYISSLCETFSVEGEQ